MLPSRSIPTNKSNLFTIQINSGLLPSSRRHAIGLPETIAMKRLLFNLIIVVIQTITLTLFAQTSYIRHSTDNNFCIAKQGYVLPIIVDSADYKGIIRAANDFQSDIQKVTGILPEFFNGIPAGKRQAIIIGTIGKSKLIDRLIASGKLPSDSLKGRWEAFAIQVIDHPFPEIDRALVIAGSDKRGTIFGIYDLSQNIGVSPWYWWADVTPQKQNILSIDLHFQKNDHPVVKYRGIFINDEAPALEGWMKKYTGGVFNHQFYAKVFELILRLKGNYLWPAMWGKSFCMDDSLNPKLADEYGIVMGTSHHEPMMRAQAEWSRIGTGEWNYATNKNALLKFWEGGIVRNKDYDNLITIGMRGDGDEPMNPKNTLQENIALMQQIVADQQQLIAKHINPDVSKVPQLWALYKEVQDYYEHGMTVPDYVTLLWCDDNWGNIRRLPSVQERKRSGGAGIYYHADYVGGPRSYKWINTIPLTKMWDQMRKAYEYGADRVWILNVGDLKPLELPIDFFLTLAWNPRAWNMNNLQEYTNNWAQLQFGEQADNIADILNRYTKYNGWIKPELLSPSTFSQINYREAETVIGKWKTLAEKAETIYQSLNPIKKDAYFQLVLYPVKASFTVNDLYYNVAKNRLYAAQGRLSARDCAAKAKQDFKQDSLLTVTYHKQIAGGKWDRMMNQPHIGYTSWRDPVRNIMPRLDSIRIPESNIGLFAEGNAKASYANKPDTLPTFSDFSQDKHYLELFAKTKGAYPFSVEPAQSWIIPSVNKGIIDKDRRVEISIDWKHAPKGINTGEITIKSGNQAFRVIVPVFNPKEPDRKSLKGFVESHGYVSIEAAHYSTNKPVDGVQWQCVPDYGRTLSSMMPWPVTAKSFTDLHNAPTLEYTCYLFSTGKIELNTLIAPTLNCLPDADMRFAVAIDNEQPQIVQIPRISVNGAHDDATWSQTVINNIRVCKTEHLIQRPGNHIIRIFMIDPIVTLQRLVLDTGGLKPSFFYPPESPYFTKTTK